MGDYRELTFEILKVAVSICVAIITMYVVPYLKELQKDKRYSTVIDFITLAVRAAEQTITGSGQGKQKKAEVIRFASEWMAKQGIDITDEELDQLIEAAVYAMKQEQ